MSKVKSFSDDMIRLSEKMVEAVIFTCAKGGFNASKKDADYILRKEREGWNRWYDLSNADQAERKKEPLVRCDCVVDVEKTWRKTPLKVSNPKCTVCGGLGRREMGRRERRAFEYALRKDREQRDRDKLGEDSCADYVMDSTYKMAQDGVWQDPLETDGYVLNKFIVKKRVDRIVVEIPVKVYKGHECVGTVMKKVMVNRPTVKYDRKWLPLLRLLNRREKEMMDEVMEIVDPLRLESARRDLAAVRILIGKIMGYGDCLAGEDGCRRHLMPDDFDSVKHLWS